MTAVISLDLGTTGNRAIVYEIVSGGLNSRQSFYEGFDCIYPKPGWVEQDPEAILETTLTVLRQALSFCQEQGLTCESIGLSNQRETIIAWDKESGNPCYNAIVWQCRRTAALCETEPLLSRADEIRQKTGLFLNPYFSGTKIHWLLETVPEVKSARARGVLQFGTVDTWIIWHLTGHFLTDVSNASRTLLVNTQTGDYDSELCGLFSVKETELPEIRPSFSDFGALKSSISDTAIPITAVLGDQQAALYALCGDDTASVKATFGTGLFVMSALDGTTTQSLPLPLSEGLLTTVYYQKDASPSSLRYAMEGSAYTAGSGIEWCMKNLGICESASEIEGIATSISSHEGVYFLPALTGLASPFWRDDVKAQFVGLTPSCTKAHLLRAVLDALAFQCQLIISKLPTQSSLRSLKVDGGVSQNGYLLQTLADVTGLQIERADSHEGTALGVAQLAVSDTLTLAQGAASSQVIIPSDNRALVSQSYEEWLAYLHRLLG